MDTCYGQNGGAVRSLGWSVKRKTSAEALGEPFGWGRQLEIWVLTIGRLEKRDAKEIEVRWKNSGRRLLVFPFLNGRRRRQF